MRRILPFAIALTLAACAPQGTNTIAIGEPNPSAPENDVMMEQTSLQWRFDDVGTEEQPMVTIVLIIGGEDVREIELGTYAGSASDTTDQQSAALLSASAWWAGGGDDVRVLGNGDGTLSLQHRTVDEVSGFGEWETLQKVEE